MKVGLLDLKQPGLFSRYLPEPLPVGGQGEIRGLAFHEDGVAWGAAIMEIGLDTVELLSLRYDEGCPPAACERALTAALSQNVGNTAIQTIVYVCQGTEDALDALDDRMLLAGFFSRPGGTVAQEAVLEQVLGRSEAKSLLSYQASQGIMSLQEVPEICIKRYNRANPDFSIRPAEIDADTSRFYVENGEICGVLLTSRRDETLQLDWLANTSGKKSVLAMLLGAFLTAAARIYPGETRLTLGAFDEGVIALAHKLGFTPDSTAPFTRVYTYYFRT